MNTKAKIFGILGVISVFALIFLWSQLAGSVKYGTYHVKQAFYFGTMSVKKKPGVYAKVFGSIKPYTYAHMFNFSKEKLDGGDGAESQPLKATFMGNSTAKVSGVCKYTLPTGEKNQLNLHRLYGSDETIKMELIRNAVAGALKH